MVDSPKAQSFGWPHIFFFARELVVFQLHGDSGRDFNRHIFREELYLFCSVNTGCECFFLVEAGEVMVFTSL